MIPSGAIQSSLFGLFRLKTLTSFPASFFGKVLVSFSADLAGFSARSFRQRLSERSLSSTSVRILGPFLCLVLCLILCSLCQQSWVLFLGHCGSDILRVLAVGTILPCQVFGKIMESKKEGVIVRHSAAFLAVACCLAAAAASAAAGAAAAAAAAAAGATASIERLLAGAALD